MAKLDERYRRAIVRKLGESILAYLPGDEENTAPIYDLQRMIREIGGVERITHVPDEKLAALFDAFFQFARKEF